MANDSVQKALRPCAKMPKRDKNSVARALQYGSVHVPLTGAPTRRSREPVKAVTEVRSVVIYVHGVHAGPDIYDPFVEKTGRTLWKAELAETKIIKLTWGDHLQASDTVGGRAHTATGMSDRAWVGAAKLKQVVAQTRDLFGFDVPITVVSHSQGTVVTLAALQEAMRVDHWILMGSPLHKEHVATGENNTHLGAAARNVSGAVLNLWSRSDDTVSVFKGGIGGVGLASEKDALSVHDYTSDNIVQAEIVDVDRTTFFRGTSWWGGAWLEETDAYEWLNDSPQLVLFLLRGQKNTTRLDDSVPVRKFDRYVMKRFRDLQNFAVNDKEGHWYGDNEEDRVSIDFCLTKGMMTGIHFDDKTQAEFTVTCSAGRVKVRLREAVWSTFEKSTRPVTVSAGRSYGKTYKVEGPYDATLFLELTGVGGEGRVTQCHLDFQAEHV